MQGEGLDGWLPPHALCTAHVRMCMQLVVRSLVTMVASPCHHRTTSTRTSATAPTTIEDYRRTLFTSSLTDPDANLKQVWGVTRRGERERAVLHAHRMNPCKAHRMQTRQMAPNDRKVAGSIPTCWVIKAHCRR